MYESAKFIGVNGSCGLIHGKVYRVKIISNEVSKVYKYYMLFEGDSEEMFYSIHYDTIHSIVKNWDFTV